MADPIHQFVIQDIVPLQLGGVDISFTNSAMWMLVATVLSTGYLAIAMRRRELVPGRMQATAEMLYSFIANMIRENAGKDGLKYFPLIFTLFIVVALGNVLGMLPYSFTYTSHIIVTAALALMIFAFVTVLGFARNGLHFLEMFSPPGVPLLLKFIVIPIEVLSFFIRPVTLSVRLFANMMAGHVVLKVFAGFCVTMGVFAIIPAAFNVLLIGFEVMIALLQAYVFTILSCIYLKDALEMHH